MKVVNKEFLKDRDKFDDDYDYSKLDQECPKCHREYDEIDFDFQICHHCGHNNSEKYE